MNARERILGKLRAHAPSSPVPRPDPGAVHLGEHDAEPTAAIQRFAERLRAQRAEVIETTASDWPTALAQVLQTKGLHTLLADPAAPSTPVLHPALPQEVTLHLFERPLAEYKPTLFHEIDAGFTEADCGLVHPGALVMRTGPAEPRTLSLVPPVHIILLRTERLFPNLLTAMRAQDWPQAMPTNLVMVSGPSKTSDIQQTLAFGAHGPRQLIVLLAHADAGATQGVASRA
ncbi:LUD domain-containing protein [Niveibacterium sp. SC-1]|uniref:LutC/YkgG family protein n=1 Tax=Niveibacterium sp. SC-1 TaxID=3135646 RepID=UPI0031201364